MKRDVTLTKIVATLGPASADVQTMVRLIEEGACVFRINFSHGSFEGFSKLLANARQAAAQLGRHVGVLGDLCGPKIRIGQVREGGIELSPGHRVVLQRPDIVAGEDPTPGELAGQAAQTAVFSTTWPEIIGDVEPGQRLLIDDGNIRMLVIDKTGQGDDQRLHCQVMVGGLVTTGKGLNAPDSPLSAPAITDWDWQCLDWAIENKLDFLAMSFVRRAEEVQKLKAGMRERMGQGAATIPIISKIEKPQALAELEQIIEASWGVMVARGDLGVEMDLAQVPVIQKQIVEMARDHGKPVIVATQMLQSMIESPTPTRAEVSDVAGAIFEGADAVMLSGETAVGEYPDQAVRMMARIAQTIQGHLSSKTEKTLKPPRKLQESGHRTAALAHGVGAIVRDMGVKLIGVWSQKGGGARYLSQIRLQMPIIAASSDPVALRQMAMMFGVTPIYFDKPEDTAHFADLVGGYVLQEGLGQTGQAVVIVAGEPIGSPGVTNAILVHYLGDVCQLR